MYFNYHAKIKNKIKTVGLIDFDIVNNYKNISPCMILYFKDGSFSPIREHKFDEYLIIIAKNKKKD